MQCSYNGHLSHSEFICPPDENVGPSSSAFYLGIFYTMAIGPSPHLTSSCSLLILQPPKGNDNLEHYCERRISFSTWSVEAGSPNAPTAGPSWSYLWTHCAACAPTQASVSQTVSQASVVFVCPSGNDVAIIWSLQAPDQIIASAFDNRFPSLASFHFSFGFETNFYIKLNSETIPTECWPLLPQLAQL